MTLRDWLTRERLPDHSGINARATLKRLGNTASFKSRLYGLAIATRDRALKSSLFCMARASA